MTVVIQPAANSASIRHFKDTVENLVQISQYEEFIGTDLVNLKKVSTNGATAMWGVTPGTNNANVSKYNKLAVGDLVIFTKNKTAFASAQITYLFRNKSLAERLWGKDNKFQTWEYMYALNDLQQIEISYEDFNRVVGYKKNNIIQGFTVLDAEKSEKFLGYLGKTDLSLKRAPSNSSLGQDSFGEVFGYPEGSIFETREELRKAGLHSKPMDGISCIFGNPADAIVLSGGYKTDIDEGDYILYTGQGGQDPKTKKQISDQVLKKGNLGLMMSKDRGIPIRVIRGSGHKSIHSPKEGYRYDGLFVIDEAFTELSTDGPWIWRFELRKVKSEELKTWSNSELFTSSPKPTRDLVAPLGNSSPERRSSGVIQRIVRNSKVTQFVKAIYDNRCQFCEIQLMTSSGGYSEGAHIRPLGGVHKGSDTTENVLCLCANCHTLFDKGALYVDEASLEVKSTVNPEFQKELVVLNHHQLDDSNFEYHRIHIAGFHKE